MAQDRRIRVKISMGRSVYEGLLTIPPMRKRVSDVINEDNRPFINLTDVRIDGATSSVPYVSINKRLIESLIEISTEPEI